MYRAFPETKLITMACFRHGELKKSTIDHRLTRATRAGFDLTTHVLGSIRFGTFLKVRVCRICALHFVFCPWCSSVHAKFEGTRSNVDRGGSDSRLFVSCRPDAVSLVLFWAGWCSLLLVCRSRHSALGAAYLFADFEYWGRDSECCGAISSVEGSLELCDRHPP